MTRDATGPGESPPVFAADGRLMFLDGFDTIIVRDANVEEWKAVLAPPSGLYGLDFCVSANGAWVAGIGQSQTAATGAYRHDLMIWRVPVDLEGGPPPPKDEDADDADVRD